MLGTSKSIWRFDPRSIPGCSIWFDAADTSSITTSSGSNVTSWTNKGSIPLIAYPLTGGLATPVGGGTNSNAYGGFMTSGTATVNGLNTVSCPIQTTYGMSSTVSFPTQARAVFAVYKAVVLGPSSQYLTFFGCATNVPNNQTGMDNYMLYDGQTPTLFAEVGAGNGSILQATPAAGTFPLNTTAMVCWVQSATSTTNSFITMNGVSQTITTNALASTYVTTPQYYFIGCAYPQSCLLCEYIMFNAEMTIPQRQSVEGYLAQKWGITLPTTHPFYGTLPFNRSFSPTDVPGCSLWLDGADNSSMNSTSAVTVWNDKSGQSNTMTGTGTWSNGAMVFNGSTNAFSNTSYAFAYSVPYSMFTVYSNTTPPAQKAYMNIVYGSNGYPVLGLSARGVVNWTSQSQPGSSNWYATASDSSGSNVVAFPAGGYVWTGKFNGTTWAWTQQTTLGSAAWYGGTSDSTGSNLVACRFNNYVSTGKFDGTTWTWTQQTAPGIAGWVSAASDSTGSNIAVCGSNNIWTGKFNGSTWAWTQQTGAGTSNWKSIASDSTGSNLAVCAGASNYIWTGVFNGSTWAWTQQTSAGSNNWSAISMSGNALSIFAGTNSGSGYNSTGTFSGGTWTWTQETTIGTGSSAPCTGAALSSNGTRVVVASKGTTTSSNYSALTGTFSGGSWTWVQEWGFNTSNCLGVACDSTGTKIIAPYYTGTIQIGVIPTKAPTYPSGAEVSGSLGIFYPTTIATPNVLVSATFASGVFSPFINGSAETTSGGTNVLTTGVYVGGPSNYFNGSISELLIYGSNLSPAQQQQVEGYLIQKWGLSTQTVTGHQYKLIPPATSQPPQYAEVTPGNWTRDWNPYLKSLAAANASGVTLVTSNIPGGGTYTASGWVGGVVGPDGNIYFAPYAAANILKLNVSTGVTTNITGGATYTASGWVGGVLGPDGNIYFAPYAATNILKLNVATGVTTNITGGVTFTSNGWLGGVLGPDGNIYFAPYVSPNILKLNVATGVTTTITGGATFTGSGWNCGVLGSDGNIYFIPQNALNILKLNVFTGVTTNITGGATYIANGWYSGVLGLDGNIYCAPYAAANILKLNVSTGVTTNITGGAVYTTYGWRGGVLGPDGNIYFIPGYAATSLLKLNISTGVTTLSATVSSSQGWQGGVLSPTGNIYVAPYASSNVLRVAFSGLSQLPSSNYCLSAYANRF